MCLLIFAYQYVPHVPIFLAANRDESPARPSLPPDVVREPDRGCWFGGRDELADGTWLGVNRSGLVVGITNRSDRPVPANAVSRGLLCRDLLKSGGLADALTELDRRLRDAVYAGFNLLLASRDRALVVEHGIETRRRELPAGLFVLTNTGLDSPGDPRGERGRREFEDGMETDATLPSLMSVAEDVCRLTERPMLTGPHPWGTVSASVIALPEDPADAQFYYAAGPPRSTPFVSCSDGLREVLRDGER
jgi:uncharacterized protein with NRDE domain